MGPGLRIAQYIPPKLNTPLFFNVNSPISKPNYHGYVLSMEVKTEFSVPNAN